MLAWCMSANTDNSNYRNSPLIGTSSCVELNTCRSMHTSFATKPCHIKGGLYLKT